MVEYASIVEQFDVQRDRQSARAKRRIQEEIKVAFHAQNDFTAIQQSVHFALSALGAVFVLGMTEGAGGIELPEPQGGFKYLE